jgi:hypothetical protein
MIQNSCIIVIYTVIIIQYAV